ncbi:MAG: AsmA-like C-terminal region-containing protein [Rhizobiaceae bacterium]
MFVAIGGLIVLLLFAALIAPYFIDWTSYKTAFETEASRVVGQPVRVGGRANIRILPLPRLTFSDLSVGENSDGTPMMTVESFSLDAELMPFLSGDVKIVDMVLHRPRITVEVNEKGAISWTARKESIVDPQKVQLEKVRVVDGSLQVNGLAAGRSLEAVSINADVSAQSLFGPWRIEASGVAEGIASRFDISTGRLQESGSIRLKVTSQRIDEPYRLTADGPVSLNEGVLSWKGSFELGPVASGEDERQPLPVNASGMFEATPERIEVPEYRLEVGPRDDPYTVTGKGAANIREEVSFAMIADGRQIDLDRLSGQQKSADTSLEARLGALKSIVDRIPVPTASGKIDLSLPAIVAGDTVIREFAAIVHPDTTGWKISSLSTILPGNTLVEASGRLGTGGDFGFTGQMLLASRQPTGFAAWLGGENNAALRGLTSAGFSGYVTLTGTQTTLENFELVLDDAQLRGKLQRLAAGKGRPAIIARLSGETIDLDDLVAIYSLAGGSEGGNLSSHDLDIAIQAGQLEAAGLSASQVNAHFRVANGALSVDQVSAGDFLGARIESSGKLSDLLGKPSGNLSIRVAADDASGLAELGARRLGEEGGHLREMLVALSLSPQLSANLEAVMDVEARPQGDQSLANLSLSGTVGGTAFTLRDRFNGQPQQWARGGHDISLKLEQDDPVVLGQQLAIPVSPIGGEGPVTITADFNGVPEDGLSAHFSASTPGTDLTVSGRLEAVRSAGSLLPSPGDMDFDVTLGSKDIDPWMLLSGYPLPGTGEGNPVSAAFKLTGNRERFRLSSLSASVSGNSLAGEVEIERSATGSPRLGGSLAMSVLSLPFLGEIHGGAGTFGGSGLEAGLSDQEFGASLFPGAEGEISVSAEMLEFGFGPTGEQFTGKLQLRDGSVSLQDATAQWLGGAISGNADFRNAQGTAIANLQMNLNDADAAQVIAMAGYPARLAGRLSAGITVDASARSLKALAASLSGSGVVSLKDARFTGIRTSGLEKILRESETDKFEIDNKTVEPLVREAFLLGTFPAGSINGAVSVTKGNAVMRNLQMEDDGGAIEAGVQASLVDGQTTISLTLRPDPGKEALAGADPSVSFNLEGDPAAMTVSTDTSAMEGYLSLRAFEREQRRVELLQEAVLEKQRLRREVIASNARIALRETERQEELRKLQEIQRQLEEERLRREEEERQKAEAEALRKAAEQAALEKAAQAEEEARRAAEAEAARKAVEAEEKVRAQAAAEAEANRIAEEQARAQEAANARNLADEQAARRAAQQTGQSGRADTTTGPTADGPIQLVPRRQPNLFEDLRKKLFGQ